MVVTWSFHKSSQASLRREKVVDQAKSHSSAFKGKALSFEIYALEKRYQDIKTIFFKSGVIPLNKGCRDFFQPLLYPRIPPVKTAFSESRFIQRDSEERPAKLP